MKLALLGSTGSIGIQTLHVVRELARGGDFPVSVAVLAARSSVKLLEEQAREFRPQAVAVFDPAAARDFRDRTRDLYLTVLEGMEGLCQAAAWEGVDVTLNSVVGMVGLRPTLAAIRQGKRIALANKETLVCAGELVMEAADAHGAEIVPVDSEHSAIFQCLQGSRDRGEVKRLILTASGGPFWGWEKEKIASATVEQALKHPNWSMGAKITVDSASLMNKGLEFIEAMRLYRLPPEKISIVVHRESIVHSLVEYCDNAILAQLGVPDMRLPIQYALTWPARTAAVAKPLDLLTCPPLTFHAPDCDFFPCLSLALEAARTGGTATAALNGANEASVALFLAGKISFGEIAQRVEHALATVPVVGKPELEDVLAADQAARRAAETL